MVEIFKIKNNTKTKSLLLLYIIINAINMFNSLEAHEIDSNSLYSENNNASLKEVKFNTVQSIKSINQFPLKIISKFPFRKCDNYTDLLFNIKFKWENNDYYNKEEYVGNFNNLEIKATIINNNKSELIDDNFMNNANNKSVLETKVDLGTKTGILKINKAFINNTLSSTNIKDNEDLYLYLIIYNNTNEINLDMNTDITDINDHSLECTAFLIYEDCNNGLIRNIFINNKIYYDEKDEKNNYNFFLLKLDEQKDSDIFVVEFSANYALSRGLYVSFLDIEDKKKIKAGDIPNNSSNIQFLKSNIKKGKIYHFEFKFKNNKTEAILCVYAKSKALKTYNYIFKFGPTDYNSFDFVKEVKYYNNGSKSIIKLENPFYETERNFYNINKEIIIRKILNKDKNKKEDLDTIGLIESKYELVEKTVNYLDKDIEIEIPKINGKDYYSIIINSNYNDNNGNEIFVFNTINNNKVSKPYWSIFVFFGVIPFYLGIMVVVIIFISRKSKSDLKEVVMTTSFKVSTANEDLNRDKEEDIDEDNLLE